jgi:hypothetical protein
MKYIINENKLSNLLGNMLHDYGLSKTLDMTGLSIFSLFDKLDGYIINSDLSYELLLHIFKDYDILTKKVGPFELYYDYDGVLNWDYNNKEKNELFTALCTPYWDGNSFTPIDANYYSIDGVSLEDNYEFIFNCPDYFRSLDELIDWYQNEYIPRVFDKCQFFLNEFRKKVDN